MTLAKRKVSLSLDEELVAEMATSDQTLSAQVNEAIRTELERRRRERLLVQFLDQLDRERGPVGEALIARYVELLA